MHSQKIFFIIGFVCIVVFLGITALFFTDKSLLEKAQSIILQDEQRDFYVLTNPDKNEHFIILTKEGFKPQEIVIQQGDTIVFATDRGVPFWPASNLHPTHGIYPEFDPKDRIMEDDTWSFTFDIDGVFKYHDHISANDTGTVVVLASGEKSERYSGKVDINECSKFLENSEKQQCWDAQLEQVLNEEGLEAAFDYFIALYQTEPDVPKECHGWGHTLGKAGYVLYTQGKEITLKKEASYCGYGYFHGFIGELMRNTGDMTQTKEFCEYVIRELKDELFDIKDNCIHGVGHGTTAMLIEQPEYWGNFQKTVDKGVEICEAIYSEERDLINCYDGIFNEIHLDLFNSNYGLSYEKFMELGDPFWYCQQQKERHKESCYFEFSGMFWRIFSKDIVAATKYTLENTEDLKNRGPKVIAKIAADQIQFDIVKDTHTASIDACRLVPSFLFIDCFSGILNGFVQHGEPGNVHQKGYDFCTEEYLNDEERTFCYRDFTRMLQNEYEADQFKKACEYINFDPRSLYCA